MENQRIRLSKSMLKSAMMELLRDKPIEKITIYGICERANINRTTFYKYYGSQFDLLKDVYNDFFTEIERHFKDSSQTESAGLLNILVQLNDEREKCRILINSAPQQEFSDKLFSLSVIETLVMKHTPDKYIENHRDYIRLFICNGGYAIIKAWLNAENPESPQDIAALLNSLGDLLLYR